MKSGEHTDTRAQIVDAAARLLQERGAAALTTRAVAEAADVQAPTIYRLFGDKDGLIDAVAEHVLATHVTAKATAQTGADPVAALRVSWQVQIDFSLANSELFGLLNAPDRRQSSPATRAGIEVLHSRIRAIAAAGVLRVDEALAVSMIHAAGTGAVVALLAQPADARDLRLADAMLDAVLWRILDESAAPALGSSAASSVAFATRVPQLPGLTDAERALMGEWLARAIAAA
jgi:AcrR family transcriptional regulator